MAQVYSIQLRQLHGQRVRFTQVQVSSFYPSHVWIPAINAYLCSGQIVVCVDLAGVEEALELRVEPRRLQIRGQREPPEPPSNMGKARQTFAMEIDYGPFERDLELPAEVDPERVTTDQRNGLLWVYLPLCPEAPL